MYTQGRKKALASVQQADASRGATPTLAMFDDGKPLAAARSNCSSWGLCWRRGVAICSTAWGGVRSGGEHRLALAAYEQAVVLDPKLEEAAARVKVLKQAP